MLRVFSDRWKDQTQEKQAVLLFNEWLDIQTEAWHEKTEEIIKAIESKTAEEPDISYGPVAFAKFMSKQIKREVFDGPLPRSGHDLYLYYE